MTTFPASQPWRLRRVLTAMATVWLTTAAQAASERLAFDLPPAALDSTINQVARQAGVQVMLASSQAASLRAPALKGEYTAVDALRHVLAGSGLVLKEQRTGSYVIVPGDEHAADTARDEQAVDILSRITVVASRSPRSIDETANTIWIIERDQIESQARAGVPLKQMLGQLVPGLDLGGQMRTNFGQNLRGQAAQVMIDGISLNGSRLLSRQFDAIDPFNIERIEVLSGATAIYGGNATGGLINIITRRASSDDSTFTSEVGVRSGLRGSDDLGWHAAQSIQGGNDTIGGRLAVAYRRNGGSYDGKGQRVLPDITQTDLQWNQSVDVMGTADIDLHRAGTLRLTAQHYDSGYRPGKALWMQPGPGNNIMNPVALDTRSGFSSDVEPNTRRHLLAADYHLPDVLGGQDFYLKAHHRKESLQFYPFPGTDVNPLGGARVPYWSTSTQETTTYGLKAMLLKQWARFRVHYGVDYDRERFQAHQTMFDVSEAIASGGLRFRKTDSLGRYPSFATDIWGYYAQAEARLGERWTLNAGVRHQRVNIDVDDFVQVAQQRLLSAGFGKSAQPIPGGSNAYATTLLNAGLLYRLSPGHQIWANYSEGFELADPAKYYGTAASYTLNRNTATWELGRHISVNGTSMAAIKTRSMELGWRYARGPWQAQAAVFHAQSNQSIAVDRTTLNITLDDAKVRHYGLEGQVEYRAKDGWYAGATALLLRTEQRDADGWHRRGVYYASPSKATLYVGRQTPRWGFRAQLAHSLKLRSDVPSFGTGDGETLPSLTLVDLAANYRIDHAPGVSGTLTVGVQNVFNRQYATRWSEQAKLAYATAISPSVLDFRGQGRTFALTYTLRY